MIRKPTLTQLNTTQDAMIEADRNHAEERLCRHGSLASPSGTYWISAAIQHGGNVFQPLAWPDVFIRAPRSTSLGISETHIACVKEG